MWNQKISFCVESYFWFVFCFCPRFYLLAGFVKWPRNMRKFKFKKFNPTTMSFISILCSKSALYSSIGVWSMKNGVFTVFTILFSSIKVSKCSLFNFRTINLAKKYQLKNWEVRFAVHSAKNNVKFEKKLNLQSKCKNEYNCENSRESIGK